MKAIIVDTDVVSLLFKRDAGASAYQAHTVHWILGISFMTLAELHRWPMERHWGLARRQTFAEYLKQYTVMTSTSELCLEWAKVTFEGRISGQSIDNADAWIAATARFYDVPLLTNNVRHFNGVSGLKVITG